MYVVISHDPSIVQSRHAAYGPFSLYEEADSLRRKLLARGVEIFETQRPIITVVPLESGASDAERRAALTDTYEEWNR